VEIKNNFSSIITLGSFNPAILTDGFLKEQEIWNTKDRPKGSSSPIISNISYGEVSFVVELERFQIKQEGISDFQDTPIVGASHKYLNILQHTPLFFQGINFNVDLLNYEDYTGIGAIFNNPISGIMPYIEDIKEYEIDLSATVRKSREEIKAINCKYYTEPNVSISINLLRLTEKITLNFNLEVGDIKEDRSRIDFIFNNFQSIYDRFLAFLETLKK